MANTVKCQGHQTVTRARKGEDGKGILSQIIYYGLSTSSTTKPTTWSTGTPPAMTPTNKFLWSYTRTNYTNGTYQDTAPAIIGIYGDSGLSYRYSKWDDNNFEYRNDNNPYYRDSDNKGIVDVVFADDIAIWDPATNPNNPPAAWICKQTHNSSASKPLPAQGQANAYWTPMNSMAPILTALVLARKIKADEIDVESIAANYAFIASLVANHIQVKNGNTLIADMGGDTNYPLFLGGPTAADAVTKVDKAGGITTSKINATGGSIDALASQRLRNPFEGIFDSFTPIDKDNVYSDVLGGSSFRYEYSLDWSVASSGRRQTIIGAVSITAPEGKYFYENGRKYTSFDSSYECSEMIGYGTQNEFFGWIVVNRTLFSTNRNFGREITPLAFGQVTGTDSGAYFAKKKLTKFNTSDDMYVEREGQGQYAIYVPSTWFVSADYIFCNLTGVGKKVGGSSFIKATLLSTTYVSSYKPSGASSYMPLYKILVGISDDANSDDDGSFQFMIYNMAQWDD